MPQSKRHDCQNQPKGKNLKDNFLEEKRKIKAISTGPDRNVKRIILLLA
jgi:hypothetical protein